MQGKKSDPTGGDQVAVLQAEVAALKEQVHSLTELAARAQADLQNARGRLERDADELRKYAAESVLRRLLPTVDNFQRAFTHLPKEWEGNKGVYPELVEWVKGITAVEQDLLRQLSEMGLEKFSPLGEKMDPSRHEVLLTGPGAENSVVEVLEDGYLLHGKVLRPAKVKVGDGIAQ
ncbi:nucleotide exchange factor GrpE [Candidatus Peregrinibacteria bacterium]|nr:nucleotide exchange factor GrpE [Candidatus Peregrinibacteria bacterium]